MSGRCENSALNVLYNRQVNESGGPEFSSVYVRERERKGKQWGKEFDILCLFKRHFMSYFMEIF